MDYRPPLGAQRPAPPQRAVSGGSYGGGGGHMLPKRPTLPSRLSSVRSVSQPVDNNVVDLTAEGMLAEGSRGGVLLKEEMIKSPDVIDLEEAEAERPAKRAKTVGDEFQAVEGGELQKDVDMAHEVQPGDALPNLPRARPSAGRIGVYRRNRFGIEPSGRKAHGIDPPAIATRVPPPKKVLDFAPWNGSHQEDVLNENVIRNGFFDKVAGANQSETNAAKVSIWPSLSQKNHAGLSALSYMYVAVMEKRQTLGKCTAPSTFKPPPRLAVQEAKRAKWLEDLADPTVSLRRLSKTIPHGIKGKLLMEQCLGKYIPLHRAMWLVRGVGMHELRAFRRKGYNEAQAASGEIKWIREWTINVTQFLEDVMAAGGQPEWQKKMDYAVKLATALYSERLLDVDYYLDWTVSSLAESSTEKLPVWIIATQILWKDLTKFGRRGRKLAAAILEHLSVLMVTERTASAPLRTSLQNLVTILAVTNRGCLVLPRTWQKYEGLLSLATSTPESPAKNVARRNERLAAPLAKTPENTRSPYLDLYDTLDSAGLNINLDTLTKKCIEYISEPSNMIPALLGWASTRHRIGSSRIYWAAAVIARVHSAGQDTDSIILQYLEGMMRADTATEDHVHRVVIELVRLQAFSVGRYLQWLIASGALYEEQRTSATSLIAALPTSGLPKHVLNTRSTLMNRLGYATDEYHAVQAALDEVRERLYSESDQAIRGSGLAKGLTKSAAYSLSQQLVEKANHLVKESGLSLRQFCTIRDVTEQIGDISSLRALVSIATSSDIGGVLATAADTVNYHAASFAVLSQLDRLVERLGEQYLALRPHQPLDRAFILALGGLAKRVPEKATLVKLLADDLILCEQQTSIAACSPASDSIIDMHATKLDSDEDIDAVFASGNVMDEQLMQRVFLRIVQRAERSASLTRVCGWLDQLRLVDASRVLEGIVDQYLQDVLSSGTAKVVSSAVIAGLTLSGCSSLGNFASLARDIKDPQVAQGLLAVFISAVDELNLEPSEQYRLRLNQERCQFDHAGDLIKLLRTSLGSDAFHDVQDDAVHFLVQSATAQESIVDELFAGGAANTQETNGRLLNAILEQPSGGTLDASSIIAAATPLSVRFSVAVKYLKTVATGDESSAKDAILDAFERRSEVWPQLLSVASDSDHRVLREKAQTILLQTDANSDDGVDDEILRTLDLLAITSNLSQKPGTVILAVIVERLNDLEKQLAQPSAHSGSSNTHKEGLLRKLDLLLRLAALSIRPAEDENDIAQQTHANLLHVLCTLLVHPALQLQRNVIEYIFDLASISSDSLPETTLASLKTRLPVDARLNFILGGSFNTNTAWLALATHVPAAGAGAGATQQQRALNKHPSQQGLQPQKSMPRSASGQQQQGGPSTTPRGWPTPAGRAPSEVKTTPFQLRRWEIISDPASTVSENDTALSLGLFGMRKV